MFGKSVLRWSGAVAATVAKRPLVTKYVARPTFVVRQSFPGQWASYSTGGVTSGPASAAGLDKQEVTARIADVIKAFDKTKAAVTITPETSFSKDLGLDSLDTVELLVAIEEEFDIEIPDKIADELKNVEETVNYIVSNPESN